MGLKLADEGNKPESGLQLSGMDNRQKDDNAESEGYDPWAFDKKEKPFVVSSTSTSGDTNTDKVTRNSEASIVLLIGQIIVYVLFALEIASVAWVCSQSRVDIYANIMKFSVLYSLSVFVCIIDAIIVNVLYGRKISLVFLSWLFPFLYLAKRGQHVNGSSGMGGLFGAGWFIALLALAGTIMSAGTKYGGIILMENETRTVAAEVMDQTLDDGSRLGDKVMNNVFINAAVVQTQGGDTIVGFNGEGNVYMDGDTFIQTMDQTIDTQLGFIKMAGSDKYELAVVILDGKELTQFGVISYRESVIMR